MFKAIAHQQGVSASEVKERIQSTICIYHKHDCRRTIAAISDALPDMDAAMRPLAEQTIHKLHNITNAAFEEAKKTKGQPTAIIAKTIKGKGVSFMENEAGWHGKAPNDEQYEIAMKDLEKAGEALCQK